MVNMKKIKITEEQAKRLGLKTEAEALGSNTAQNNIDVLVNGLISGEALQTPQTRKVIIDKIIGFWAKVGLKLPVLVSPSSVDLPKGPYLAFYEKTGNIVLGRVIKSEVSTLIRQLTPFNLSFKEKTDITASKNVIPSHSDKARATNVNSSTAAKQGFDNTIVGGKPTTNDSAKNFTSIKKTLKITKEQYNKLKSVGVIKESEMNGVDKSFKKAFAGKDIKNLKPVSEENGIDTDRGTKFNISQPNKSLPASGQKLGKPVMEGEGQDQFKKETQELIKYLYRKSEDLSPFWEQNGITYDDICDTLLSKKLIVKNGGKFQLSKKLGDPQVALQTLESELRNIVGEPTTEAYPMTGEPELEMESNYPDGAEHDSNAPWNQKEPDMTKPNVSEKTKLVVASINREMAVLKGPDGSLYALYYEHLPKEDFMEYASVPRTFVGKDEDGQPEYDYDFDDVEIDADVIGHYVNDKLDVLSKGEGIDDYEQGIDLVKIDEPLKQELLSLYDKDKNITKVLGPIEEAEFPELWDGMKDNLKRAHTPKPETGETPAARQSRIVTKLQDLKAKEEARRNAEQASIDAQSAAADDIDETTAVSSGAVVGPMSGAPVVKKDIETPIVAEMTAGSDSMGAYDANALPGIGRNGEFKGSKKTKAETTPQWAGGSFVKQPKCAELDNNKSAQNGGCNQGVDSLKIVKTKGSINAPSLGENEIIEAIAKKTGKTIDEVRQIIQAKKIKG